MKTTPQTLRIAAAVVLILGTVSYLAFSGVQSNKSYYVTIGEMKAMEVRYIPVTCGSPATWLPGQLNTTAAMRILSLWSRGIV